MSLKTSILVGICLGLALVSSTAAQINFGPAITQTLPTGSSPTAVAVGDLNGDRLDDLIIACSGTQELQLHRALFQGGFALNASILASSSISDLSVADLDHDDDLDLIVADDQLGEVRLYWNDGSGNFGAPTALSIPGATRVFAADLDDDGADDLIVIDDSGSCHYLAAGSGLGMTAAVNLGAVGVKDLAIGDFNNDSHLDLALLVTAPSTGVTLLLGDGLGGFTATSHQACGGSFPRSIEAGDLDLDGDLDLAIALFLPANTVLMTNDGSGIFSSTLANAGVHLTDSVLTDVDADGDLDLIVLDVAFDSIWVAENTGTTVLPALQLATSSLPGALAIGDFDGDYDDDLITFSETEGSFSSYQNLCSLPRLCGPLAAGTVGLSQGAPNPEAVLKIDNLDGGSLHRVDRPVSSLIFISMDQPMTNIGPAYFVLWGRLGVPNRAEVFDLPLGLGQTVFVPHPAALMSPEHFTATNNLYADPLQLAGSFPAPWNLAFLAPPSAAQVTFQALILDGPGELAVTNAVIVDVR